MFQTEGLDSSWSDSTLQILDSLNRWHAGSLDLTGANQVTVGEGEKLLLVSADWPLLPVPGGLPGQTARAARGGRPRTPIHTSASWEIGTTWRSRVPLPRTVIV